MDPTAPPSPGGSKRFHFQLFSAKRQAPGILHQSPAPSAKGQAKSAKAPLKQRVVSKFLPPRAKRQTASAKRKTRASSAKRQAPSGKAPAPLRTFTLPSKQLHNISPHPSAPICQEPFMSSIYKKSRVCSPSLRSNEMIRSLITHATCPVIRHTFPHEHVQ